jgi:hypothetical protein
MDKNAYKLKPGETIDLKQAGSGMYYSETPISIVDWVITASPTKIDECDDFEYAVNYEDVEHFYNLPQ